MFRLNGNSKRHNIGAVNQQSVLGSSNIASFQRRDPFNVIMRGNSKVNIQANLEVEGQGSGIGWNRRS